MSRVVISLELPRLLGNHYVAYVVYKIMGDVTKEFLMALDSGSDIDCYIRMCSINATVAEVHRLKTSVTPLFN